MRKIENEMNDAIDNYKDFVKGNTSVFFIGAQESGNPNGARSTIYLYNNHIADFWHESGELEVDAKTLARFPTATTKSRLRALGAKVTTKKGVTFLNGNEVTY
jgi:hypothetical protein